MAVTDDAKRITTLLVDAKELFVARDDKPPAYKRATRIEELLVSRSLVITLHLKTQQKKRVNRRSFGEKKNQTQRTDLVVQTVTIRHSP